MWRGKLPPCIEARSRSIPARRMEQPSRYAFRVRPSPRRYAKSANVINNDSENPLSCYEPHYREQRDGATERNQQSGDAEVALIDRGCSNERAQQPSAEQCADYAHDDVQYDSLLCIGFH